MKNSIKYILVLFLSIILAGCGDDGSNDIAEYHDVIIIGAGMAGLEAASVLKAHFVDVAIVEARDRVGGRLLTTTMDGVYTDLGASWFHDISNNVLVNLANNLGVPIIPTPATQSTVGFYDNGVLINPAYVDEIFNNFPALNNALLTQQYASCGSLAAATDCFIQANISAPAIPYAIYGYNLFNASWFADNTNYISSTVGSALLHVGEDALPSIGYTNFINDIFNIKSLNIKLNTVVSKINYSNNEIIVSSNNRIYRAKYVIVTVPIGVLKANTIQFIPSLPQDKQTAIQHLGVGSFNKIFLQFNTIFWDNTITIFAPYTTNQNVNYYMIYNYGRFLNNKPILLALDFGNFSRALEQLTDSQIIDNIMTQIRLIYPAAPDPVSYQITRWGLDPFANGAYAYPTIETTVQDYHNLTIPVQNKLFFAGEAVNDVELGVITNKSGTADAAYLSGQNAANSLLKIFNPSGKMPRT